MRAVRNYETGTGEKSSGNRAIALGARLLLAAALLGALWWFGAPHAAAHFNARGLTALSAGNQSDAISHFEWAAWFAPRQPEVRTNLFHIYQAEGRFADATAEAEQMVALQPGRAAEWKAHAEELRSAAKYAKDAETRLSRMKAEGWADDDASVEQTRDAAETLFQIGRYTDAILVYERLLFKTPHDWAIEEWIQELERRVREGEALTDEPDGPRAIGLGGADEPMRIAR